MNVLRGQTNMACEDTRGRVSISPFSAAASQRILSNMEARSAVPDTLTLAGDPESRVAQLLRLAQHQARVAQTVAAPRMQDALADLEDALSDQLALLDAAADDDKADAEESGEAERERRPYHPLRAA
jgi:hypothetical protein